MVRCHIKELRATHYLAYPRHQFFPVAQQQCFAQLTKLKFILLKIEVKILMYHGHDGQFATQCKASASPACIEVLITS